METPGDTRSLEFVLPDRTVSINVLEVLIGHCLNVHPLTVVLKKPTNSFISIFSCCVAVVVDAQIWRHSCDTGSYQDQPGPTSINQDA